MEYKRKNLACLILAKSSSDRLRNKNVLPFDGKPMFLVNVEKCLEIFDKVYVSSDSDDILDWADSRGAIAIKRPLRLCGDTPNIPVYQHALKFMGDIDGIVAVQANSPSIHPKIIKHIKNAMEVYQEVMTVHASGRIYGSVWAISTKRLKEYKEKQNYYSPHPDFTVLDTSEDIHNRVDYELAQKQWRLLQQSL